MTSKRPGLKLILVMLAVAFALWVLYPPSERLKGGIDLVGGHSLLFEIDTAGLEPAETAGLAQRVLKVLKDRIDPYNQLNLEWRPIGNNRIEIRMPRPPEEALQRRRAFEEARERVAALNVRSTEVAQALSLKGEARRQALEALVRGVEERRALLEKVAQAYDRRAEAIRSGDDKAVREATEAYVQAMKDLRRTNINMQALADILELQDQVAREERFAQFVQRYPERRALLEELKTAYDRWAEQKGYLESPEDLKRMIAGAGVLEFRILARRDRATGTTLEAKDESLREPVAKYVESLQRRGPRMRAGDKYVWCRIADPVDFMFLRDPAELENFDQIKQLRDDVIEEYAGNYYVLCHNSPGMVMLHPRRPEDRRWELKRAVPSRDERNRPCVLFEFNAVGGDMFYNLTAPNVGERLCILLDNVAISAPVLQSAIRESGRITGDFTWDRVTELVNKLEAGALPARVKPEPISEKGIGPQLGAYNRTRGIQSAIWGTIGVAAFMALYYLFAGLIADAALIINIIFVLAVMAGFEATMTLPGIAGLVLTVGMAVDANVLIFERIREESRRTSLLRLAVRNGYGRAFWTIFDTNLTTILVCLILGYVGTEEIKGFALTLGVGIVTSMFTSLLFTRWVFEFLIERGWVRSVPMLSIPGIAQARVDWMRLSRFFVPVSLLLIVAGVLAFDAQPRDHLYDIEFLGGTSAQIQLAEPGSMSDEDLRRVMADRENGVAGWLLRASQAMQNVQVRALGANTYELSSDFLGPDEIETLLLTSIQGRIPEMTADRIRNVLVVRFREERPVEEAEVRRLIARAGVYAEDAADRLASARIQLVTDVGPGVPENSTFEIITLETNKKLVRDAITAVLGDRLKIRRGVEHYRLVTDPDRAPQGLFPIDEGMIFLSDAIGGTSAVDITDYMGGVVLVFDELEPPLTEQDVRDRLADMRLQPDYEQYKWREPEPMVVGLEPAPDGSGRYRKLAIVVGDQNFRYDEDPRAWRQYLAEPELTIAEAALTSEGTLQKVVKFDAPVANEARTQAFIAIVLACIGIVVYLWLRFGSLDFGLAAIVALVHDVSIAIGLVALSYYISQTPIGHALLIYDFRIDLTLVAAFLTIVGYSINDTIVVFDRIRENRGKLTTVTPPIVNTSINQTLARTILTSGTTLIVVLVMYVLGGPGIHGFSFALLVGILVGTYSSVAIASPLLLNPVRLRLVVYGIVALLLLGMVAGMESATAQWVVGGLVVVGLAALVWREWSRRAPAPVGPAGAG